MKPEADVGQIWMVDFQGEKVKALVYEIEDRGYEPYKVLLIEDKTLESADLCQFVEYLGTVE